MTCIDLISKRSKKRKTPNAIKLRWICIDLTSKRSKMLSSVANHSKQRKTTKVIKIQWIASIWNQNDLKCWVTSKNIQNNAKLQKRSKYNDLHRFDFKTIKETQNSKRDQITMNLHRFDVQTIKNVEFCRKPFKTTQNYKSDQNTMNCIDLMSKVI